MKEVVVLGKENIDVSDILWSLMLCLKVSELLDLTSLECFSTYKCLYGMISAIVIVASV